MEVLPYDSARLPPRRSQARLTVKNRQLRFLISFWHFNASRKQSSLFAHSTILKRLFSRFNIVEMEVLKPRPKFFPKSVYLGNRFSVLPKSRNRQNYFWLALIQYSPNK